MQREDGFATDHGAAKEALGTKYRKPGTARAIKKYNGRSDQVKTQVEDAVKNTLSQKVPDSVHELVRFDSRTTKKHCDSTPESMTPPIDSIPESATQICNSFSEYLYRYTKGPMPLSLLLKYIHKDYTRIIQ